MNEEQKNIETCLAENILDEVANVPTDPQFVSLTDEALDPLKQQALQQAGYDGYIKVAGTHQPYTFTSQVAQMKSNLILLLRRLWRFPFGRGTIRSLADMWQHYITRLKGNPEYGIPSRLSQLTDLPSAPALLADRDMSSGIRFGTNPLPDGMSLAQLLCSTDAASSVTEIVDTNSGYTMTGKWNNAIFPSLKELTINCDTIALKSGRPFSNTTIERLSFPSCKTIDGKYAITYNGFIQDTKVPIQLDLPILEVIDQTNGGAEHEFFKGSVQFKDDTLRFPKLKHIIGANYFFYTQLNFPRYFYLDELQSFNGDWGIGRDESIMELFYAPKITQASRNNPLNSQYYSIDFNHYINLIDVWVGEWNSNLNLSQWSPINVVSNSEKVAILNHNIREHIAARIADRTGNTALTITFRTTIFSVLENETIAAFTNKNWTVANTQNMV